jgi:hypothetical protein
MEDQYPRNANAPAERQLGARANILKAQLNHTKNGNSAQAQRARLLAWLLAHHRITTFGARRDLDIPHPAARIQELREAGHNIITQRVREPAVPGKPPHIIGLYVLLPSEQGAASP